VDNPIKRYAIGDRNPLKYNEDGSLDLYLTHQPPGADKTDNWLPIPDAEFQVSLRIYMPNEDFLKDRSVWNDPKPERID
jgi:hypothetical protein